MKGYRDQNHLVVAPTKASARDAGAGWPQFDLDTVRLPGTLRSTHEKPSDQIKRQFIRKMPIWLRAKFLEQAEYTTVENLFFGTKTVFHPQFI